MGNKVPVFNGRLPTDIVKIILLYVDPFTVKSLPRVCRQFRNITKDKSFYLSKLARDFPMFIIHCNSKECYICMCKLFAKYTEIYKFIESNELNFTIDRKGWTYELYKKEMSHRRIACGLGLKLKTETLEECVYLQKSDMTITEERLTIIKDITLPEPEYNRYQKWKNSLPS